MMMKRNMKLLMLASLLGFVALSAQAVPAKKGCVAYGDIG